ncbi:MAG: fluoride efflux transporter CrcB [Vicinamibacteraceae bacterium]
MERFLWICLAGAAGTGTRYVIALWAAQRFGSSFPYGTLIVNLLGCFGIAAVMHMALTLSWSPTLRSAITIGFIGGLTTYSSFNYETSRLLEEGAHGHAVVNAMATIVGSFAAGWLGLMLAKQLLGR